MLDTRLHYTVVGLGITGLSVVEFLLSHQCQVAAVDTRTAPPNLTEFKTRFPTVPLTLGGLTNLPVTDVLVMSPGVSLQLPEIIAARAKGIRIIGDIELFAQVVKKNVVAVTGSNGKSTVVTLLHQMAIASGVAAGLGGNIGVPALSLLQSDYDLYILELSSFQLELTESLQLAAATILNISPDHLDRHASFSEYQAAKMRIYRHAKNIIVNQDEPNTIPLESSANVIGFGSTLPTAGQYGIVNNVAGELLLARGQEIILSATELKLLGKQNILNVLVALALADVLGLARQSCLAALKEFSGLAHRCQLVTIWKEVMWINDSKGTNVGATIAALAGVAAQITGKIVIILGGISKGADLSPLLAPVLAYCKAVIVIGEAKELFKALFTGKIPCYEANSMQQCVTIANEHAVSGDSVLLSPACSSLDMFTNYEARGCAFQKEVLALMEPS